MTTGAIIVAAGSSERMGGRDKLLQQLDGRPMIAYSIAAFAVCSAIDRLVVVVSEANRDAISKIASQLAPEARTVLGGARRQDSVRAGLEALQGVDYVLVHDGARPLVTQELIDAALRGAIETGAALCAVPLADTLKRGGETGLVRETLPREGLWLAQTPQAFRYDLLRWAHETYSGDATDDAIMVEQLDRSVRLVRGSARNLKVTTPEDLRLAEALLRGAGIEETE
jgi:2-C-methyl-D-erythritol 4-phosphate cytidylyltransferase